MDISYYFQKLHDGTNQGPIQGDKAALAKVYVPRIRETLQTYHKELTDKGVNLNAHESGIALAEQRLDQLEDYFGSIIDGKRKTMNVTTAREYINFVEEQVTGLEKMLRR
jgi:archaellum component FlaC